MAEVLPPINPQQQIQNQQVAQAQQQESAMQQQVAANLQSAQQQQLQNLKTVPVADLFNLTPSYLAANPAAKAIVDQRIQQIPVQERQTILEKLQPTSAWNAGTVDVAGATHPIGYQYMTPEQQARYDKAGGEISVATGYIGLGAPSGGMGGGGGKKTEGGQGETGQNAPGDTGESGGRWSGGAATAFGASGGPARQGGYLTGAGPTNGPFSFYAPPQFVSQPKEGLPALEAAFQTKGSLALAQLSAEAQQKLQALTYRVMGDVTPKSLETVVNATFDKGGNLIASDGTVLATQQGNGVVTAGGRVVSETPIAQAAKEGESPVVSFVKATVPLNMAMLIEAQHLAYTEQQAGNKNATSATVLASNGYTQAAAQIGGIEYANKLAEDKLAESIKNKTYIPPDPLEGTPFVKGQPQSDKNHDLIMADYKANQEAMGDDAKAWAATVSKIRASVNEAEGTARNMNAWGLEGKVFHTGIGDFSDIVAPGISMQIITGKDNAFVFRSPSQIDPLGRLMVWTGTTKGESTVNNLPFNWGNKDAEANYQKLNEYADKFGNKALYEALQQSVDINGRALNHNPLGITGQALNAYMGQYNQGQNIITWNQYISQHPDLGLGTPVQVKIIPDPLKVPSLLTKGGADELDKEIMANIAVKAKAEGWSDSYTKAFINNLKELQGYEGETYYIKDGKVDYIKLSSGEKLDRAKLESMYPNANLPTSIVDAVSKTYNTSTTIANDFNVNRWIDWSDSNAPTNYMVIVGIGREAVKEGKNPVTEINRLVQSDKYLNRESGFAQEGNKLGLQGHVFSAPVDENTNLVAPRTIEQALGIMTPRPSDVVAPHSVIQISTKGNEITVNIGGKSTLVTEKNAKTVYTDALAILNTKEGAKDTNARAIVEVGSSKVDSDGRGTFNGLGFVIGLKNDLNDFPNKYVNISTAPPSSSPAHPLTAEGKPERPFVIEGEKGGAQTLRYLDKPIVVLAPNPDETVVDDNSKIWVEFYTVYGIPKHIQKQLYDDKEILEFNVSMRGEAYRGGSDQPNLIRFRDMPYTQYEYNKVYRTMAHELGHKFYDNLSDTEKQEFTKWATTEFKGYDHAEAAYASYNPPATKKEMQSAVVGEIYADILGRGGYISVKDYQGINKDAVKQFYPIDITKTPSYPFTPQLTPEGKPIHPELGIGGEKPPYTPGITGRGESRVIELKSEPVSPKDESQIVKLIQPRDSVSKDEWDILSPAKLLSDKEIATIRQHYDQYGTYDYKQPMAELVNQGVLDIVKESKLNLMDVVNGIIQNPIYNNVAIYNKGIVAPIPMDNNSIGPLDPLANSQDIWRYFYQKYNIPQELQQQIYDARITIKPYSLWSGGIEGNKLVIDVGMLANPKFMDTISDIIGHELGHWYYDSHLTNEDRDYIKQYTDNHSGYSDKVNSATKDGSPDTDAELYASSFLPSVTTYNLTRSDTDQIAKDLAQYLPYYGGSKNIIVPKIIPYTPESLSKISTFVSQLTTEGKPIHPELGIGGEKPPYTPGITGRGELKVVEPKREEVVRVEELFPIRAAGITAEIFQPKSAQQIIVEKSVKTGKSEDVGGPDALKGKDVAYFEANTPPDLGSGKPKIPVLMKYAVVKGENGTIEGLWYKQGNQEWEEGNYEFKPDTKEVSQIKCSGQYCGNMAKDLKDGIKYVLDKNWQIPQVGEKEVPPPAPSPTPTPDAQEEKPKEATFESQLGKEMPVQPPSLEGERGKLIALTEIVKPKEAVAVKEVAPSLVQAQTPEMLGMYKDIVAKAQLLDKDIHIPFAQAEGAKVKPVETVITPSTKEQKPSEGVLAFLDNYKTENKDNPDSPYYNLAKFIRENPDGESKLKGIFEDKAIEDAKKWNEQSFVKKNPVEEWWAAVKAKGGDKLDMLQFKAFLAKNPDIREKAVVMLSKPMNGENQNAPVSLESYVGEYMAARGLKPIGLFSIADSKEQADARDLAVISYRMTYGDNSVPASLAQTSAAFFFAPARGLYPEVGIEKVTPLEWGIGALQLATLGYAAAARPLFGAIEASSPLMGSYVAKLVERGISTGLQGAFVGAGAVGLVGGWNDMTLGDKIVNVALNSILLGSTVKPFINIKGNQKFSPIDTSAKGSINKVVETVAGKEGDLTVEGKVEPISTRETKQQELYQAFKEKGIKDPEGVAQRLDEGKATPEEIVDVHLRFGVPDSIIKAEFERNGIKTNPSTYIDDWYSARGLEQWNKELSDYRNGLRGESAYKAYPEEASNSLNKLALASGDETLGVTAKRAMNGELTTKEYKNFVQTAYKQLVGSEASSKLMREYGQSYELLRRQIAQNEYLPKITINNMIRLNKDLMLKAGIPLDEIRQILEGRMTDPMYRGVMRQVLTYGLNPEHKNLIPVERINSLVESAIVDYRHYRDALFETTDVSRYWGKQLGKPINKVVELIQSVQDALSIKQQKLDRLKSDLAKQSDIENTIKMRESELDGLRDIINKDKETLNKLEKESKPTNITKEAQDLLDKVEAGGVPGFMSQNLQRIARENGITQDIIDKSTPNQVIDMLRHMRGETTASPEIAFLKDSISKQQRKIDDVQRTLKNQKDSLQSLFTKDSEVKELQKSIAEDNIKLAELNKTRASEPSISIGEQPLEVIRNKEGQLSVIETGKEGKLALDAAERERMLIDRSLEIPYLAEKAQMARDGSLTKEERLQFFKDATRLTGLYPSTDLMPYYNTRIGIVEMGKLRLQRIADITADIIVTLGDKVAPSVDKLNKLSADLSSEVNYFANEAKIVAQRKGYQTLELANSVLSKANDVYEAVASKSWNKLESVGKTLKDFVVGYNKDYYTFRDVADGINAELQTAKAASGWLVHQAGMELNAQYNGVQGKVQPALDQVNNSARTLIASTDWLANQASMELKAQYNEQKYKVNTAIENFGKVVQDIKNKTDQAKAVGQWLTDQVAMELEAKYNEQLLNVRNAISGLNKVAEDISSKVSAQIGTAQAAGKWLGQQASMEMKAQYNTALNTIANITEPQIARAKSAISRIDAELQTAKAASDWLGSQVAMEAKARYNEQVLNIQNELANINKVIAQIDGQIKTAKAAGGWLSSQVEMELRAKYNEQVLRLSAVIEQLNIIANQINERINQQVQTAKAAGTFVADQITMEMKAQYNALLSDSQRAIKPMVDSVDKLANEAKSASTWLGSQVSSELQAQYNTALMNAREAMQGMTKVVDEINTQLQTAKMTGKWLTDQVSMELQAKYNEQLLKIQTAIDTLSALAFQIKQYGGDKLAKVSADIRTQIGVLNAYNQGTLKNFNEYAKDITERKPLGATALKRITLDDVARYYEDGYLINQENRASYRIIRGQMLDDMRKVIENTPNLKQRLENGTISSGELELVLGDVAPKDILRAEQQRLNNIQNQKYDSGSVINSLLVKEPLFIIEEKPVLRKASSDIESVASEFNKYAQSRSYDLLEQKIAKIYTPSGKETWTQLERAANKINKNIDIDERLGRNHENEIAIVNNKSDDYSIDEGVLRYEDTGEGLVVKSIRSESSDFSKHRDYVQALSAQLIKKAIDEHRSIKISEKVDGYNEFTDVLRDVSFADVASKAGTDKITFKFGEDEAPLPSKILVQRGTEIVERPISRSELMAIRARYQGEKISLRQTLDEMVYALKAGDKQLLVQAGKKLEMLGEGHPEVPGYMELVRQGRMLQSIPEQYLGLADMFKPKGDVPPTPASDIINILQQNEKTLTTMMKEATEKGGKKVSPYEQRKLGKQAEEKAVETLKKMREVEPEAKTQKKTQVITKTKVKVDVEQILKDLEATKEKLNQQQREALERRIREIQEEKLKLAEAESQLQEKKLTREKIEETIGLRKPAETTEVVPEWLRKLRTETKTAAEPSTETERKPSSVPMPSISAQTKPQPYPETRPMPKTMPEPSEQTKPQVSPMPSPQNQPKPSPAPMAQVRAQVQPKPQEKTQPLPKPEIITKTITEEKTKVMPPILVKTKHGMVELTEKDIKSALAWKQGWAYKFLKAPYRQNDMITSKKPIPGVEYKEGVRSAYESAVVLFGGELPRHIQYDMGVVKVNAYRGENRTKPIMHFDEQFNKPKSQRHSHKSAPSDTSIGSIRA